MESGPGEFDWQEESAYFISDIVKGLSKPEDLVGTLRGLDSHCLFCALKMGLLEIPLLRFEKDIASKSAISGDSVIISFPTFKVMLLCTLLFRNMRMRFQTSVDVVLEEISDKNLHQLSLCAFKVTLRNSTFSFL